MKGKKLTVEQVKELPHGTRIVVRSVYSVQDHALINQERKMIGNYNNRGIDWCIWHFKNLEESAEDYDIKFYEYIDETIKIPTTLEEGYEFKVGDIVTGLNKDQWLMDYKCKIMGIHGDGTVDLKYIETIESKLNNYLINTIDYSVWSLDELKLVSIEEIYITPKEEKLTEMKSTDTFTKSMLKTGHLVQTRNGKWWFVFRDLSNECFEDGLVYLDGNTRSFTRLDNYTEDLKRKEEVYKDYEIIKVATCRHSTSFFAKEDVDLITGFETIWQRKEINNTSEKNGVFRHTIDGNTYAFEFKDNKISTIDGKYKGVAKCHPEDEFNKDKGCRLALARAKEKEIKANLNQLHKEIEQLTK